jgi:hypothetical protein
MDGLVKWLKTRGSSFPGKAAMSFMDYLQMKFQNDTCTSVSIAYIYYITAATDDSMIC